MSTRFKLLETLGEETSTEASPAPSRPAPPLNRPLESGAADAAPPVVIGTLQFDRTLETDDELQLDHSDRSIPFHVCRNCNADNPLYNTTCHVCAGALGGPGQREHDRAVAEQRQAQALEYEQNCQAKRAEAARAQEQARETRERIVAEQHLEGIRKRRNEMRIVLGVCCGMTALIFLSLVFGSAVARWLAPFFGLALGLGAYFFLRRQVAAPRAALPRSGPVRQQIEAAYDEERLAILQHRRGVARVMLAIGAALLVLLIAAPFVPQYRLWLLEPIFLIVGLVFLVRYLASREDPGDDDDSGCGLPR